jgi:hypothetical protein
VNGIECAVEGLTGVFVEGVAMFLIDVSKVESDAFVVGKRFLI